MVRALAAEGVPEAEAAPREGAGAGAGAGAGVDKTLI
jgi:hypothetical protein